MRRLYLGALIGFIVGATPWLIVVWNWNSSWTVLLSVLVGGVSALVGMWVASATEKL
jgi:hypothetical protein